MALLALMIAYYSINILSPRAVWEELGGINVNHSTPPACPYDNRRNNLTEILLDPALHNQNILDGLWGIPDDVAADLFSSCHPTCKVRIIPGCPFWELETFDCQNRRKAVGGDEFYLTYSDRELMTLTDSSRTPDLIFAPGDETVTVSMGKDSPIWMKSASAVAWLTDMNNGRYRIDFQASPMSPLLHSGSGVFTVYFHYTCGIGRMAYPLKSTWHHGGQTLAWAQSLELPLVPPIRPFEPPPERPNLNNYSTIIPVGDSLLINFLSPLGIKPGNIRMPLNSTTLQFWKWSIHDQIYFNRHGVYPRPDLYSTWDEFENRIMDKVENLTNTAIIAGSCAWDIMENQDVSTTFINGSHEHEWQDHRTALTNLIAYVHEQYPEATMLWKSCAGLHLHISYQFRNVSIVRIKHMSTYRAWSIHQAQLQVVQKAKQNNPGMVFFLDVYPAFYLSADRCLPEDGRHYDSGLNTLASSWFVNNKQHLQ
ncbi:hypothetical protein ACHAXA_007071 [Cyclostephanos tholiformis]|uniref:Uncharacterized protein n=1 Tax=Cyclostephanos tholiformis TaxID=382380 RepID=A0ABD3R8A7_9STRA